MLVVAHTVRRLCGVSVVEASMFQPQNLTARHRPMVGGLQIEFQKGFLGSARSSAPWVSRSAWFRRIRMASSQTPTARVHKVRSTTAATGRQAARRSITIMQASRSSTPRTRAAEGARRVGAVARVTPPWCRRPPLRQSLSGRSLGRSRTLSPGTAPIVTRSRPKPRQRPLSVLSCNGLVARREEHLVK